MMHANIPVIDFAIFPGKWDFKFTRKKYFLVNGDRIKLNRSVFQGMGISCWNGGDLDTTLARWITTWSTTGKCILINHFFIFFWRKGHFCDFHEK